MPDITDGFSRNDDDLPDDWSREMVEIWEHSTNTYRELYDTEPAGTYENLQHAFEQGWFDTNVNEPGRQYWREEFYNIAGIQPSGFDWESWRAYLGY